MVTHVSMQRCALVQEQPLCSGRATDDQRLFRWEVVLKVAPRWMTVSDVRHALHATCPQGFHPCCMTNCSANTMGLHCMKCTCAGMPVGLLTLSQQCSPRLLPQCPLLSAGHRAVLSQLLDPYPQEPPQWLHWGFGEGQHSAMHGYTRCA